MSHLGRCPLVNQCRPQRSGQQERSGELLTTARIWHTGKPLAETKPIQSDLISEDCRVPQSKAGFSQEEACTVCTRPPKHNPLQIHQWRHTWKGKYTDSLSVVWIFRGNVHTVHLRAETQCLATENLKSTSESGRERCLKTACFPVRTVRAQWWASSSQWMAETVQERAAVLFNTPKNTYLDTTNSQLFNYATFLTVRRPQKVHLSCPVIDHNTCMNTHTYWEASKAKERHWNSKSCFFSKTKIVHLDTREK